MEEELDEIKKTIEAQTMFAKVSMVKRLIVMNIDYAIKWEIIRHLPKKRQSYYRDYLLDSSTACKE